MKIRILVFSLIFSVLFIGCSFAGGSGNCVEPIRTTTDHLGVGAAFEYNYVHQRLNKLNNKQGPKDMEVKDMNQVYGKFDVGLFDNFNLYGKIGGSNYDLNFIARTQDAQMVIDLESGLYTGMGMNALFPMYETENSTFGIGMDVQGNVFLNDVKGIRRAGEDATGVGGSFYGLDGQNSVYLVLDYNIEKIKTRLVPYIGAYQSWILIGTLKPLSFDTPAAGNVDKKHYQAAFDMMSFGLTFGMDIDIAKYVVLNIEGRLIGETAITTGATIKF